MNTKPIRLLSLALCMAMLIGMLPGMPVKAEELDALPEESIVESAPEVVVESTPSTVPGEESEVAEGTAPEASEEIPETTEASEEIPETSEETTGEIPEASEEATEEVPEVSEEVSEEETIIETEEAVTLNEATFTQADFVAGLENELDEYGSYYLSNSLTLNESLVISNDVTIYMNDGVTLTIPTGITLTLDDADLIIFENATIAVNGNLNLVNNATVQATGGVMNVADTAQVSFDVGSIALHVNGTAAINGIDPSRLHARSFPTTTEELESALAAGAGYSFYEVIPEANITLTKSLVIPYDVLLNILCINETANFTVPSGITLTNNGIISVQSGAVLEVSAGGTLVNNGQVNNFGTVTCDGTWEGNPVYTQTPIPNSTFYSFEELKEIAATVTEYSYYSYEGEGPLVISESFAIPSLLSIYAEEIIVSSGVTLSVSNSLSAMDLEVAGTIQVIQHGYVYAENSVTITGSMNIEAGALEILSTTALTGVDKVTLGISGDLVIDYYVSSKDDLDNAMATIASSAYPSTVNFVVLRYCDIVLNENFTLPSQCQMNIATNATLTVAEGCTFTVSAGAVCTTYSDVIFNGSLVNNGNFNVQYDQGGHLVFNNSDPYSGYGILRIFSDNLTAPDAAVTGLDVSQFDATVYAQYSKYWELSYAGDLTKLGTPTELAWGMEHHGQWDEETQTYIPGLAPGRSSNVSWKNGTPNQYHYRIEIYQENGDYDLPVGSWSFSYSPEYEEVYEVEQYAVGTLDLETGEYYFTVQSVGDHTQYRDSDVATSGLWSYTKPDAKLGTATNLTWNGSTASFTAPDSEHFGGYEIDWLFSPDEENPIITEENIGAYIAGGLLSYDTATDVQLFDHTIQACGNGYYFYRVRPLSNDISLCCNGEWSEISPAYHLTENTTQVKDELDSIISNESSTVEEKVEAVQNMDTNSLKEAMMADNSVVDQIAALENIAGGAVTVDVVDSASAFAESQISIVGANLNIAADAAQDITLVVDKPEAEHVIPEAYDNSVAVSFSMDLTNVEDSENLDVPVQITLPVPATINPDFLVILHYHAATGDPEIIYPFIYTENGQLYAEFVLTSFSDFIMTEAVQPDHTPGDMNGDGVVNDADVEQLLWFTLFGETFPIVGDADFNGDGNVTDADVECLLWHTLFPDSFPL
ncbi:MAG: hypothetical protein IJE81_06295 [Oscillospiraceae bacterium]|nr:hypothetical protein [Oscillospiraceae bacterium]